MTYTQLHDEIAHVAQLHDTSTRALCLHLAEEVLAITQVQQLKRFVHGAAQHAASVGMEKSMEKYLEAMGLDEITIEWVLS